MPEIKVWVLAGVCSLMLGLLGYLGMRWDHQREKHEEKIENYVSEINKSITDLRLELRDVKTWSCEKFITKSEITRIKEEFKVIPLTTENHNKLRRNT